MDHSLPLALDTKGEAGGQAFERPALFCQHVCQEEATGRGVGVPDGGDTVDLHPG